MSVAELQEPSCLLYERYVVSILIVTFASKSAIGGIGFATQTDYDPGKHGCSDDQCGGQGQDDLFFSFSDVKLKSGPVTAIPY